MSEAKVNQKSIQRAAEATINPFESLSRMPGTMEPNTPRPGSEGIPFDAEVLYGRKAAENNRHPELSRIETKWKLSIICILNRKRINSRLRTTCLFSNGSEITCDLSTEAALFLEPSTNPSWKTRQSRVRFGDKVRNFGYYEQALEFKDKLDPELKPEIIDMNTGEVISEAPGEAQEAQEVSTPVRTAADIRSEANDIIDEMVARHHPNSLAAANQVNGDPVNCAICARELTNPESRRIQIGPVCREKVGMRGESHLRGDIVSQKLVEASRLYKDAKLQKWILQGCLQLNAPIPVMVIPQRDTEYWSLKRSPRLYYLSKDNKAHCLYKVGRKLTYKRLTALCRETELDDMAWNEAKDLIECLEANGGKKPRTIQL